MILTHLGREQTVEALGRSWRLARFDRAVWAAFLDWARPLIPHPLDVIKDHVKDLPPEQATALVEKAAEEALVHLQSSSRPVQQLLFSAEGITQVVFLLARKHQPEVTLDDAFGIAMELLARSGLEVIERLFATAEGVLPPAAQSFLDLFRAALGGAPGQPSPAGETGLGVDRPDTDGGVPPAPLGNPFVNDPRGPAAPPQA